MADDPTRRGFLQSGTLAAASLVAASATTAAAGFPPEPSGSTSSGDDAQSFPRFHSGRSGRIGSPADRGRLTQGFRGAGLPPVGVEMPDLPKLPWKMVNGVKEFHLVAEVIQREFLPGQFFYVWGYNGSMPGPLIEANQGDRVRLVVHNHLPEATTVHWHGGEMAARYDGVEGLNQEPIPAGETFAYEYDLHQDGTYFYHSHGAMQEIMGMSGLFVIHPKDAYEPAVDHDIGLIFQQFSILPQSYIPNSVSMAFNWFTINGRSGPYTTPMVVRHGSRVRIRLMNLSAMNHHPIHLHGHSWWNTGTEAGRIPESAWIPGNTVLVGVAQTRDMEFIANNPGDWIFHCHIPHHMMNHMTSMTGPARMLMGGGAGMGHAGRPGMGSAAGMTMPAALSTGPGIGQPDTGPALGSQFGPSYGRGLGGGTNPDHATRAGSALGGMGDRYHDSRWNTPGFPQDMMEMKEQVWGKELPKITGKPEAQGMRHNWYIAPNAMMTVLRFCRIRAIAWCKPLQGNDLGRIEASILPFFRHFSFLSHCHQTTYGRNRPVCRMTFTSKSKRAGWTSRRDRASLVRVGMRGTPRTKTGVKPTLHGSRSRRRGDFAGILAVATQPIRLAGIGADVDVAQRLRRLRHLQTARQQEALDLDLGVAEIHQRMNVLNLQIKPESLGHEDLRPSPGRLRGVNRYKETI